MTTQTDLSQLSAVASRLREMREIMGWTMEEMAEKTEVSADQYRLSEAGRTDMPFTFIHKSAQAFNMELTELLEGHNARLSSYTVTRRGTGESTAQEDSVVLTPSIPSFRLIWGMWLKQSSSKAKPRHVFNRGEALFFCQNCESAFSLPSKKLRYAAQKWSVNL